MRRTGTTQAALLLEELTAFAGVIDTEKTPTLVRTLFSIADELNVLTDKGRGFGSIANNQLRIYWLLNRLVLDRFDLAKRDEIYRAAMESAALEWMTDFAESCAGFFEEREDGSARRGEPYVSESVATEFRELALRKVREAAADRSLISHPLITTLLFSWLRLNGRDAAEVRAWTDEVLDDPAFVLAMARDIPSESWSFGMGTDEMGDRVSRRAVRANIGAYRDILDVDRMETRIHELIEEGRLSPEQLQQLTDFRDMPRGSNRREEE
jgi:hypothetical protein